MPDPPRHGSGYRIYRAAHVRFLRFILRSRDLDLSMEDIRGLMELDDGVARSCDELLATAPHHPVDIRARI